MRLLLAPSLAGLLALAPVARGQASPGDVLCMSSQPGNVVALHDPAGPTLLQGVGASSATWVGQAFTRDGFPLTTAFGPWGWEFLRFDGSGNVVQRTILNAVGDVTDLAASGDGRLAIADPFRRVVHLKWLDGSTIGELPMGGTPVAAHLVEFNARGDVWVFDSNTGGGRCYDVIGQFLGGLVLPVPPRDVLAAEDGTFWISARGGAPTLWNVDRVGTVLDVIVPDLATAGASVFPAALGEANDGTLWVANDLNAEVVHVDRTGQRLGSFTAATGGVPPAFVEVRRLRGFIGVATCAGVPNSTGRPGVVYARGEARAAAQDLILDVRYLPPQTFGVFLAARTSGFVANPGGSVGNFCLGPGVGRFIAPGQVQSSGPFGRLELPVDTTQLPQAAGPVSILAGETWHFQAWYRDVVGGQVVSNFTSAHRVSFN